jgi:polyisoprenoid-binding protein YceI
MTGDMMNILSRGVVACMLGSAGVSLCGPRPIAAQSGAGQTRRPAATSNRLQVDPGSSRIYVKVTASGRMGHEHGILGRLDSGFVDWGGKGELNFSTRSFVADPPEARRYVGLAGDVSDSDRKKTTDNMLGEGVLDVARHPTATYKLAASTPLDGQHAGAPGRYRLDGTFTLHGVTRTLAVAATVEETTTPGVFRMRGTFPLVQTQFEIRPYSALGGLVGVADRLEVLGDFVLKPVAAAPAPAGPAVLR